MQITLETHGGLAAGMKRQPQTVETDSLDEPAAREVERLVQGALAEAGSLGSGASAPDAMSYTVSLQGGAAGPQVLRQSDASMSPGFAELLDWLDLYFSSPGR